MPKVSKVLIRLLMGLACTLFFAFQSAVPSALIQSLENRLLDIRFKIRGPIPHSDAVVIAAIDEKSIERLGRWPWSRDVLARLVDRLAAADASVIAFDVLLSEHESHDRVLADAIERAGNVILPVNFDVTGTAGTTTDDPHLQAQAIPTVTGLDLPARYEPITASQALLPVDRLRSKAMGLGNITMFPDRDGTLRWEALLLSYHKRLYPSLAMLAAAQHLGVGLDRITVDIARDVRLGSTVIPTDGWGRMPINYYGGASSFEYVSIADILDGSVPHKLANRVVVIGATAVGIYDLRVTPFSAAMPGVEKHASVISSIIDRRFIRQSSTLQNLLLTLISGLVISIVFSRTHATSAALAALSAIGLLSLVSQMLFSNQGIWLGTAAPLLNILVIFTGTTIYSYRSEERTSREIRRMFSSYVTERVVSELIRNPDLARLGGERREVSVLFSDIKRFTTFSERYSPAEVVSLLNEYLSAMTDVIFSWEGTLDKFVGDEIMVFWGAPLAQDDHAERALLCALDMQARLSRLQAKWAAEGKPLLEAGIGINSGDVLVGNIGAEGKKMDYTVIGDNVNLGARVESLTRTYGRDLLITEFTLNRVRERILSGVLTGLHIEGLAKVVVKGKEQPVALYAVSAQDAKAPSVIVEIPEGAEVVRMTEK